MTLSRRKKILSNTFSEELFLTCFAFIFARGGSKGVKRKNIRSFAGKPLIAYSIELAKACSSIDKVFVSTEDEEIARISKDYGAEVPFVRPKTLAEDDSPEWLAWQHAVREISKENPFDLFVSLPATAPLRSLSDVEACIQAFNKGDADIVVTAREAQHNPYFNMLAVDDEGFSHLLMDSSSKIEHRQAAPAVYDMATVAYVTSPDFILAHQGVLDGRVKSVIVPFERSIDIDTELDFEIAEYLYERFN